MATTAKKPVEIKDSTTTAVPPKAEGKKEPRVWIILPLPPENEQQEGVDVDLYEHVTINGKTTLVKRGVHVEVPVSVYLQLRNRYPNI